MHSLAQGQNAPTLHRSNHRKSSEELHRRCKVVKVLGHTQSSSPFSTNSNGNVGISGVTLVLLSLPVVPNNSTILNRGCNSTMAEIPSDEVQFPATLQGLLRVTERGELVRQTSQFTPRHPGFQFKLRGELYSER